MCERDVGLRSQPAVGVEPHGGTVELPVGGEGDRDPVGVRLVRSDAVAGEKTARHSTVLTRTVSRRRKYRTRTTSALRSAGWISSCWTQPNAGRFHGSPNECQLHRRSLPKIRCALSNREIARRPCRRARAAPTHRWSPLPNARCEPCPDRAVARSRSMVGGGVEMLGITVGRAPHEIDVGAGRKVGVAEGGVGHDMPEVAAERGNPGAVSPR